MVKENVDNDKEWHVLLNAAKNHKIIPSPNNPKESG